MYAIIQTGGKQYRVTPGDVLDVERLSVEPSAEVTFDQVLAIGDEQQFHVGKPTIEGARVRANVIEARKAKKVIAFKFKRRKGSERTKGHRQSLSRVKIIDIQR